MKGFVETVLILFVLVNLASGHAVLTSPKSWNPNPSTSSPCGAGRGSGQPVYEFTAGVANNMVWKLIANDGNGPVNASISLIGSNSPTAADFNAVKLGYVSDSTLDRNSRVQSDPAKNDYALSVTIPRDITCTGPNNTCVLQLRSTTNWYSCLTFHITATPTPPADEPEKCAEISKGDIAFCPEVSGRIRYNENPQLATVSSANSFASTTLNFTWSDNLKKAMFNSPNATGCPEAYRHFLCGLNFPLCGYSDSSVDHTCKSSCAVMKQVCSLDPSHYGLYDCDALNNNDKDSTGECNNAASLMTSVMAPLLAIFVCFFLRKI